MMAAGQQKKRLASSNLHEKCRWKKKKKKRDSSDYMLNFKSRVHLEWDERLKKALAKSEQIGVAWRDMAPFIDGAPRFHLAVADVFSVPREIFNLHNLTELLSYEVNLFIGCDCSSTRRSFLLYIHAVLFSGHIFMFPSIVITYLILRFGPHVFQNQRKSFSNSFSQVGWVQSK